MEFSKNVKSLKLPMVQGSLNPNIILLHKKNDQQLENKNLLVLYKEKNTKMPIKSVKMKISKNKKMRFFLMSQGSLDPKIRFLGQKVCSVARVQTHRQTHRHESEYRGHPFRVSGIFPSTYHQGSVQLYLINTDLLMNQRIHTCACRSIGPILDDRLKEEFLKP